MFFISALKVSIANQLKMEQDLTGLELQQQKTTVDQKKEVYVLELENSVDNLNQKLKSAKAKSLKDNFKIKLQQKIIEKQNTELQQQQDEIRKLRNEISQLNKKLSNTLTGELYHTLPGELYHTLPEKKDYTLPSELNHTLPDRKDQSLPGEPYHTLPEKKNQTLPDRKDHTLPGELNHTLPDRKYQSAATIKLEEYVDHISEIENKLVTLTPTVSQNSTASHQFQYNEDITIDERFKLILDVENINRIRQNEEESPQTREESFEQLSEMEVEHKYRPNDEDVNTNVEHEYKFLPMDEDIHTNEPYKFMPMGEDIHTNELYKFMPIGEDIRTNEPYKFMPNEVNQFRQDGGHSKMHSSSFDDPTPSTSMKMEAGSHDDNASVKKKTQTKQNKTIKENKTKQKKHKKLPSNKLVTLTPTVSQNLTNKLKKKKKSLECDQCQLTFHYQYHFKTHMEQVHQNIKPFQCPQCPKSFRIANHCKSHFERVHEKRRKPYFKCQEWDCKGAFYSLQQLQKHMKLIHGGVEKTHMFR